MKMILVFSCLLSISTAHSQSIIEYVFPAKVTGAKYNFVGPNGKSDPAANFLIRYERNGDTVIANQKDYNYLLLFGERYYYYKITDSVIYQYKAETSPYPMKVHNLGARNVYLKIPKGKTSVKWIYKESDSTSYESEAKWESNVDSSQVDLVVTRIPIEKGKKLIAYTTKQRFVKNVGLKEEWTDLKQKKVIYMLQEYYSKLEY